MRNLIVILTILFLANGALGQINFFNLYTDNGVDIGNGVVQLEDSSYVVTGSSSSFSGSSEVFLLKVDSLGDYIWSHHYGGPESESGQRVLYKKNFGFFVCGFTNSIGNGGFDNYLIKVDESGTLEWERTYGGTGWEKVNDAALTRDTGVIMVGETSSNPTDNQDIYIVRTNISGDTLWTKTIGGMGDDFATCIRQYNDSSYVIGGQVYLEDSLLTKGVLIYLDDHGQVFWQDTIGTYGDYRVNDFVFEGAEILGIGYGENNMSDGVDLWYFREFMTGDYGGEYLIPSEGTAVGKAIISYGDDSKYYIAYNNESPFTLTNGYDISVANYIQAGLVYVNSFHFGFDNPDEIGQFIRTNDGGAIMVGATTGVESGGNEIYLAKIGPNEDYPDPTGSLVINNVVDLNEVVSNNHTLLYPNPAKTVVNIVSENLSYDKIKVLDLMGNILLRSDFNGNMKLNIESFSSGVYFLELSGSNIEQSRLSFVIR